MSVFKDYLAKTYAADPGGLSRFVSGAVTLIRVNRRYWRGYRQMQKPEVSEDGNTLDDTVATRPKWKLCPKEVLDTFASLDKQVGRLIETYCYTPANAGASEYGEEDADATAIMVGGGRYAVDAAVWPRMEKLLRQAQTKWAEEADEWTTEDGYARFHDALKTQLGEGTYARVKDLVPNRQTLRGRYGLFYRKAPVRFVDDVPADGSEDLRGELIDLLDLAVRRPREEAAQAWCDLADRLVDEAGEALHPPRRGKDGTAVPGSRAVQGKSLAAVRAATEALARAERYLDEPLRGYRTAVLRAIPDHAADQTATAKILNTDDAEAAKIGRLLREAATAARDETGMCAGLGEAVAGK